MKRILLFLIAIFFTTGAGSTGIGANDTTASCDNNTLGQTSGTANMEIDWQPNTIGIRWYDGETQLNVQSSAQSCVYSYDLYLPTTPTKTGYTFKGWTVAESYTQLEYVTNTSGTYLNTGIIPNIDDIEMEIKSQPTTGSWYIFQNENLNYDIYGISGSYDGNTILLGTGVNMNLQSSIRRYTTHTYIVKGVNKYGNMTLYVKDLTTDEEDTKTGTYTYIQHTAPFWLFGNQVSNHRVAAGNRVYYAKMKIGGLDVMNYIPAKRNSDNAIGFYDTVSGTFKTVNEGSLIAGPVVQ